VMAHGMFSAGLLGSFLLAWIEERPVRRFKVRFLSPVWPGDILSAGGEVVSTATKEGKPVALLALRVWREGGSVVVSGEAEVECPEAQQGTIN
jgi:acyl dehydratase